ncbi:hypothetical protein Syun_015162 [Stephania yunnanensis]|uniref:DUF632 domain-containing protein n=1 Tax=Stephania yunnanensis TaxID=152371 RepID=A0AAP0P9G1_9MAGN
MGCAVSKLHEEDDVVSICKERKRLLKSAVELRYALADAHCKYSHSLCAVSAALKLFVTWHSPPTSSSQYLITFPPPCPSSPTASTTTISNPLFLQQTPTKPTTQEAIACSDSTDDSSDTYSSDGKVGVGEVEEAEVGAEEVFEYYYRGVVPPPMPSPQREFGWDFFNPFDVMRGGGVVGGFRRISDEDDDDEDLRAVREEEGIPELEEEEVERERGERKEVLVEESVVVDVVNKAHNKECCFHDEEEDEEEMKSMNSVVGVMNHQKDQNGLSVVDTPARGRELLEALQDVQDHFSRAYDSAKEVSRMLEVNRVHLQSGLDEIKENSAKLIKTISWHRSTSSHSSSCKSLLASSSKGSTWTEFNNDLFDDSGGMDSGSHSSTLGRLYAWEKKLYEEVKAGDDTRKMYERKCSQLRKQDVKGDDARAMDKTRSAVRDLYTRILVAIRTAESISIRIEKLRDDELQPQLLELIKGLMRNWKVMLESHDTQSKIMLEVKSYSCSSYGRFTNDSLRRATRQLEIEIDNWRACFIEYISAQKAYIQALDGWLSKFIVPEVEFCSRGRSSIPPYRVAGPPILLICQDWLSSLDKLPDKGVAYSMKSFSKDVKALWIQQGEEQQQKRNVDILAKNLDKRSLAFQQAENRMLEMKPSNQKAEMDMEHHDDNVDGRKELLDNLRKRLDAERDKHHNCMQETQRMTLNGFQTGLCSLFDSLAEFSKASLKMFDELVQRDDKDTKVGDAKGADSSYIESSQLDEGGG